MTLERGVAMACRKGNRKNVERTDDAVTVVRRVVERRMSGQPSFRDELDAIAPQLRILEERELKVRSLGGTFGRVEMSPYVHEMLREVVTGQAV